MKTYTKFPYRTEYPDSSETARNSQTLEDAFLKGGFVNIGQKFFRVFGITKLTLMLAFTVVGYNLERIRSFLAKKTEEAAKEERPRRAKRRKGTWTDVAVMRPTTGPDPPPG